MYIEEMDSTTKKACLAQVKAHEVLVNLVANEGPETVSKYEEIWEPIHSSWIQTQQTH